MGRVNEAIGGRMPGQGLGLAAVLGFAAAMTLLVALLTPGLARFESAGAHAITRDAELPPAERAAHYEWKLNEPTLASRLSAWGLYGLHQLAVWGILGWGLARKNRLGAAAGPRFADRLDPAGLAFFAANLVFGLAHLLQTRFWYDGLAQDVPVASSQYSVIVMLILVLIIQNDRRGLLFGWKAPMPRAAVDFVKKYHGFYVAWALVYTLWFHPMTGTVGHLAGFFYLFALLGQGVLLFTRLHVSLRWSAFLEGLVLLHGASVAYAVQGTPLWIMFYSGFGFMFVATQLWGLKLSRAWNGVLIGLYAASVLALYSGALGGLGPLFAGRLAAIHQVLWIPITLYGLVPVFLGLAWLLSLAGRGGRKAET